MLLSKVRYLPMCGLDKSHLLDTSNLLFLNMEGYIALMRRRMVR